MFEAYDMDGGDAAPSVYYGLFALRHMAHFANGLGLINEARISIN